MARKGSDETKQLLEVVIEHFDEKIKVLADVHLMLNEKIDRFAAELRSEMKEQGELLRTEMRAGDARITAELRAEMKLQGEQLRDEIHAGDAALREELGAFRTEVKTEFTELRAMMKLSYAEIDARFVRLEATVGELAARLDRLERRTAS